MKNYQIIVAAFLLILASCGINNTGTNSNAAGDSSLSAEMQMQDGIQGFMQIKDTITIGDPVELKFRVFNPADTASQFLKWSTPFEPLVSKYLDITDEDGTQVDYRGAMAKRAMPPSADSYIKLNPGDSLVANVNLLEGYAISRASKYKIVYVATGMSGITVKDSVYFVYR
ncbi:MAG: protease [Bacteroidota bacterium]